MRCALLIAAVWVASATAQQPAAKPRIELALERFAQGRWNQIEPGLVLAHGDRVRFRVLANFAGYLYVTASMTSGTSSLLFPSSDTGSDNRIEADKTYLVPATQAWFRIDGPPGHDITYWLVSPVPLGQPGQYVPAAPAPGQRRPPGRLTPRCDDALLRARGECVDSSAGLKTPDKGGLLPRSLEELARKAPGDLLVMRRESATVIASPVPLTGPIVYEFRIAHE